MTRLGCPRPVIRAPLLVLVAGAAADDRGPANVVA